ncbi:hypothetical protein PMI04_015100 [Sphingobium sp. AP49]|uniref:hypothetical protein n=1 Tax=Sphingobium sp. AP49 TaxID=1144307 RepID=UPI0002E0BDF5|nr:hypothetical protein [Sphingobium sp. AP49]WHO37887.1 hypothetical protein PMI04_015100 [Sphingobium sp. AP49]
MIPKLKLTLLNGARFELPAAAITIVEERSGEEKGCAIAYDIDGDRGAETLGDQYGYVKKQAIDAGGIQNPIELTALNNEGVSRLVTISRDRILARKEVLDSPIGVKSILSIANGQNSFRMTVADTLDQIDGIESPAKRAAKA